MDNSFVNRAQTKMISKFLSFAFAINLIVSLLIPAEGLANPASSLVISEVQTGSAISTEHEFIEIFNPLNDSVDMTGWKVEYISASGLTVTPLITFNTSVPANSILLLSRPGYLNDSGVLYFQASLARTAGHVRLVNSSGQQIDLVAWGSSAALPETASVPEIQPGSSAQRFTDCVTEKPVDTNNNSKDFVNSNLSSPGNINTPFINCPIPAENPPGGIGAGESSCEGVIISELLPNPSGADTDNEFIELHNPTSEPVSLAGCHLETSANTKVYNLPDIEILPGEFMAFYSSQTKLILENSSGGSVYLFAANQDIDEVDYEASLGDDISWALLDGIWTKTFAITPGTANELLTVKPCPAGQIRNAETGRCVNIPATTTSTPCKPGQERNPATNRCRNIVSTSATLKACAPDQVRNPETNRCRKADSGSLTPCKPGQQRNPDTNRCRNITGASSEDVSNIKDVLAANSTNKTSWAIAGGTFLAALSYALWEWRRELMELVGRLKVKVGFTK